MAVSMLVFWLLFCLSLAVLRMPGAAVSMLAADIAAAYWQQRRLRRLERAYARVRDDTDPTPDAQLELDAPFYDLAVERNQVESVKLVRALPANGTRTNGYGGISKSYGHFNFDSYGACMLYVYNNAEAFIQLNLTGDDPAYVFLNAETAGETGALYEEIQQWLTTE